MGARRGHMKKALIGALSLFSVTSAQTLPVIDTSDGSSPAVAEAFDCQPPTVDLAADSSGLTMTLTTYFATNSDNAKGLPVENRTVFTGGVFTTQASESQTTDRIGDQYFNSATGLLESTYFYDPTGTTEHKESYPGYCASHAATMTNRDGLMEQYGNSLDTITTQCAGQNQPAGGPAPAGGIGWTIQNDYLGSGQCTGRRVATYHRTLDVFRAYDFVGDTDPNGGDTTLSWRFTTVELAEAETAGGTVTARYHTHAFTLDFSQTAAVTITTDSGAMLTPSTLQMTSMDMARVSGTQATIQWTFTSFLQQPIDYANDPAQYMHIDPAWLPSVSVAGYSVVCSAAPALTSAATPAGSTATGTLPPAIQSSLSSAIQTGVYSDIMWKQFDWTLTCDFQKPGGTETVSDNLVIPATTITFQYAIMETCVTAGCVELTDTNTRPTLAFTTSTTLPGAVVLPLEGTLIDLNTLPATSTPIVDHIDANKNSLITTGSVAWTQAVGFQVALQNIPDRTFWHLTPQFILITAHSVDAAAAPVSQESTYISPNQKLDIDWCGLDASATTLVGAIALSDGDGTGTFKPSGTSNFYDADPSASYITEALNTQITWLLANNKILDTNLVNFAGLGGTITGQNSYVVSATDGSYVVPMRNQLKLGSGASGGFSVRFCAITHLEPTPQRRHLSSANRKLLATDFTMTMSDGTDADNQAPLPSSSDLSNTFFEPEPTHYYDDDHDVHYVRHHDHSAEYAAIAVGGIFVVMVIVIVTLSPQQGQSYRRLPNHYPY